MTNKISIIGAGATGASTAFWLSQREMADLVTILREHRIVRPGFEGEHPVRNVAFPPLGQSKLRRLSRWEYIISHEARPAEV